MKISTNLTLKPGVYDLPAGLKITADNLILDGNGAVLVGHDRQGAGVTIQGRKNVTIRNLVVMEYFHGIQAIDCELLVIEECRAASTAEVPPNTDFLNVWLPASETYGGGFFLHRVNGGAVRDNDLTHQMNGMHLYSCQNLNIERNNASYCSGWGFHLYETSDCLFENNWADYCCRYHPRGERHGHMGADAAGFLIVSGSCRNIFRRNMARMGGDGFFLAGMNAQYQDVGCNDNLFDENDGSYSPNIAFEATFSSGNIFRGNLANACNYGFWLGFSRRNTLENNQVVSNRQAGVAVENGVDFTLRQNRFELNQHGILLWSKRLPDCELNAPENDTSRDWMIEENSFVRNTKAIRIAANQDHGIRPLREDGAWGLPTPAPHHHTIQKNRFQHNVQDFDLVGVETTNII
jgi:parallel beta-helix repeat protein